MKPMPNRNDAASVFGLGRSGRALITHLVKRGVRVYAFDDAKREDLGDIPLWLSSLGVPLFTEGRGEARGDFVFRTPAMRPDHPALLRAALRGAVISGEAEYFVSLCPSPVYAVTGSDGKTTTSTMLAGLLQDAGIRTYLGGNIGRSLLPFLDEMTEKDVCVLELSSFQLIDMECRFTKGIVTNLTPNHLNWHKSFEEYVKAKRRLPEQSAERVLPCGLFEDMTAVRFSLRREAEFVLRDGVLCGYGIPLCRKEDVKLLGEHNLLNLLAASAAAASSVTPDTVKRFATRFCGAPHRMQRVGEWEGVTYIDSSIDTTPTRTAVTVGVQKEYGRLLLLLGGRSKGLSYEPLISALAGTDTRCFLFGEAKEEIARALFPTGRAYVCFDRMEDAFFAAEREAAAGDIVLLSPSATSYDAFADFEARGDAFSALVNEKMKKTKDRKKNES